MGRIAGLSLLPFDESIKKQMLSTMHHGYMEAECSTYEHCVLLKCDTNLKQVSSLNFGEERYGIVLDGILYNSKDLIHELNVLGHQFSTRSDSEVLLHAYVQWGREMLQKLLGAFAFAIWEEKSKRLVLARDQMGVKPLFYKVNHDGILFSSEIKTILSYPEVSACIDAESIAQLLLIGPGRIPGKAIFKDICELEPGMYGVFEDRHFTKVKYWRLKDRVHTGSLEETAEGIRSLVYDSIIRQSTTNQRIGSFLSGGLDSSVISAVLSNDLKERGERLDTFSVDYLDNDINFVPGNFQPERDNDFIKIMTEHIHSNHHWTVLDTEALTSKLQEVTIARDLPGMGDVDASLFSFCCAIKQKVDVALSGECADEIFGGYPWFAHSSFHPLHGFPWAENIDYRASFINKSYTLNANEYVMDHIRSSLDQCELLTGNSYEDRRIKEMTWMNQYWFMQTLIDRNDRMSICSGLEIRTPFCDHRIAEYMFAVPWTYKHYKEREKGLLRLAMKGIVPDEILWRKKSPYPKTFDPSYANTVKNMLCDLLSNPNATIWNVVDISAAKGLLEGDMPKPWYGQLMKTPQTIAFLLQIDVWLNKYNITIL